MLDQEDAKKDREDYILSLDEMSANDFPSPTDVNKDTPETECNGKYILYPSISARTVIGQLSGPYSTILPAKFKSLF